MAFVPLSIDHADSSTCTQKSVNLSLHPGKRTRSVLAFYISTASMIFADCFIHQRGCSNSPLLSECPCARWHNLPQLRDQNYEKLNPEREREIHERERERERERASKQASNFARFSIAEQWTPIACDRLADPGHVSVWWDMKSGAKTSHSLTGVWPGAANMSSRIRTAK